MDLALIKKRLTQLKICKKKVSLSFLAKIKLFSNSLLLIIMSEARVAIKGKFFLHKIFSSILVEANKTIFQT